MEQFGSGVHTDRPISRCGFSAEEGSRDESISGKLHESSNGAVFLWRTTAGHSAVYRSGVALSYVRISRKSRACIQVVEYARQIGSAIPSRNCSGGKGSRSQRWGVG